MDARDLLLDAHAGPHRRLAQLVCTGLSESQLRESPPGHVSVAWLLWHTARTEDVAINTVLRGDKEVLDQGAWLGQLGLDARDIGTGMTDEEVGDFGRRVHVAPLRAYHQAVGEATQAWLRGVDLTELDGPLDVAARLGGGPTAFRAAAGWVAPMWAGRPQGDFLTWMAMGHNYWHLGEADHVGRQLGRSFQHGAR